MLRRARWREDGRLVHLVAARQDGDEILATIDTSDQWNYRATLHTGEKGQGWPLDPVQRWVRGRLREIADSA